MSLPNRAIPVVESTGRMTDEWYRSLFDLAGAGGDTSTDLTVLTARVDALETSVDAIETDINTIDATLATLQDDLTNSMHYYHVEAGQTWTIGVRTGRTAVGGLTLDGTIVLDGRLLIQ